MDTKPKKYKCTECNRGYYIDAQKCPGCFTENTVQPLAKDVYKCYLNGVLHGAGDLEHVNVLIKDYVVNNKLYGKSICEFTIKKIED